MKNECNIIFNLLYGIGYDQDQDTHKDYHYPEFSRSPTDTILIVSETNSEFYPSKYIYKRECYEKLRLSILNVVKDSPVAVIGDPGIGKSTFLKYIFYKKIEEFRVNGGILTKMYWEMESGEWLFFDGNFVKAGNHDNEAWKAEDVLVLIDGELKSNHLQKRNNIILYCSPQPHNYIKLIKTFSGATFVMPCWDLKEITQFLNENDTICEIMDKFYERMFETLDPDELQVYENRRNHGELIDFICPELSQIGNYFVFLFVFIYVISLLFLFLGSVSKYDENERIKILTKRAFLIEQVLYRYKLCGGRIRLLLHNQINFNLLKKQVIKSVHSLSLDDIKHQECLDLQDNVPSLIYSLNPLDIDSDPRDYKVSFASNFITEIASSKMIYEYTKKLNVLFLAMQNQKIGGSLIGQIFESLVIESIATKKLTELKGKILEGEKVGKPNSINFGDFESKDYDANDKKLHLLIDNAARNLLLTPVLSNAAAVNAIFYDFGLKKIFFLQMTISTQHEFKFKYLQNLADSLKKNPRDIELIFLVPKTCYQSFCAQSPLTTTGAIMKKIGFEQSVMAVPEPIYSKIESNSSYGTHLMSADMDLDI